MSVVKKGRSSYWTDLWTSVKSVLEVFTIHRIPPSIDQPSEKPEETAADLQIKQFSWNKILQKGDRSDSHVCLIRQMVLSSLPDPSCSHSHRQIFDDLMSPTGIRSVWEKNESRNISPPSGYLIGPGDVYGGDYTIYPTHDPSTSHALATINVLSASTVSIRYHLTFTY